MNSSPHFLIDYHSKFFFLTSFFYLYLITLSSVLSMLGSIWIFFPLERNKRREVKETQREKKDGRK